MNPNRSKTFKKLTIAALAAVCLSTAVFTATQTTAATKAPAVTGAFTEVIIPPADAYKLPAPSTELFFVWFQPPNSTVRIEKFNMETLKWEVFLEGIRNPGTTVRGWGLTLDLSLGIIPRMVQYQ
jgi:hypothetical protein